MTFSTLSFFSSYSLSYLLTKLTFFLIYHEIFFDLFINKHFTDKLIRKKSIILCEGNSISRASDIWTIVSLKLKVGWHHEQSTSPKSKIKVQIPASSKIREFFIYFMSGSHCNWSVFRNFLAIRSKILEICPIIVYSKFPTRKIRKTSVLIQCR